MCLINGGYVSVGGIHAGDAQGSRKPHTHPESNEHLGARQSRFKFQFCHFKLGGLGQDIPPAWASVSSFVKQGNEGGRHTSKGRHED